MESNSGDGLLSKKSNIFVFVFLTCDTDRIQIWDPEAKVNILILPQERAMNKVIEEGHTENENGHRDEERVAKCQSQKQTCN